MKLSALALPLLCIAAGLPNNAAADEYQTQIDAWHAARIERLQAKEGWLSLVGLHWLVGGSSTVGKSADNDIELAIGPAQLGVINVDQRGVILHLKNGQAAQFEGAIVDVAKDGSVHAALATDKDGSPSVVRLGDASFTVIDRSPRLALRVRDPNAQTRTKFKGIERFPVNPDYRIVATLEAYEEPQMIEVVTIVGSVEPTPSIGKARFTLDGRDYGLELLLDEPDATSYFVIFGDRTNGRETYGMARFLYAERDGDTVIVDFNKAYNPPCAFTPYATCPMPPDGNRLDTRVEAGEKKVADDQTIAAPQDAVVVN